MSASSGERAGDALSQFWLRNDRGEMSLFCGQAAVWLTGRPGCRRR